MSSVSPRHLKLALFALFFLPGVALASWVTRTPGLRDMLQVSVAEMGMVLFGMSIGAMTGVLCAGPAISRLGARKVSLAGLVSVVISLLILGWAAAIGQQYVAMAGLAIFGLGVGLCEIAVNIEGAALERATGSHIMHVLHGCFSLGALVGAMIGFALTAWGVGLSLHLWVMAVVMSPVVWWCIRNLPAATGLRTAEARARLGAASAGRSLLSVVDGRLLMIGLVVLGVALAEGAATDWLPILMFDEYGVSKSTASVFYMAFAGAVTFGRLAGSPVLKLIGRRGVVQGGAGLAAVGMVIVIWGTTPWIAIIGVIAWGLGVSMTFPMAISAAADGEGDAEQRVKLVAVMGYCAFLAGPPLLGLLGEALGLRSAMILVLGFALLAMAAARSLKVPEPHEPLEGNALS